MHALIVTAHPAASSFTHAVASVIAKDLQAIGHTTEIANLATEGFDPVFGSADHATYTTGHDVPEDVTKEQRRIDRADHLILVYPVYWWSMPALLKGWIDRVFIAGWAFREDADGGLVKKLGRLRVHLIALGGADEATYARRGYDRAMGTQIERGIFDFCGAPVVTSQRITTNAPDPQRLPHTAAQSIIRHLS